MSKPTPERTVQLNTRISEREYEALRQKALSETEKTGRLVTMTDILRESLRKLPTYKRETKK